ncbi:MAG: class I SAM-dependent methyltransferase [Streptomycetales bacterium]
MTIESDSANTEGAKVGRRPTPAAESTAASRRWWDGAADEYQERHGDFLQDVGFIWSPEGLDESAARLLGEVAGLRVLEVGCGAAQCGRWLLSRGASPVGADISARQLAHSGRLDARTGLRVPVVQADTQRLPFADGCFDVACSAYGALPFVADAGAALGEVSRVLRPGGRWVFSVTHPVRWCFPDDPGPGGLVARDPYFDRRPYVEEDARGVACYAEHHRTLGDWVRLIVGAGMRLVDLVEPEWPEHHTREWGGWSPVRGRIIPGTAIFVCERP